MKRIEPEQIGDVLREVFRRGCMQDRLDECQASDLWPSVVGENIAQKCRKPWVEKGVMSVRVADAALRHELTMTRSLQIEAINKRLGKEIIKEIRFIS